MNGNCSIIHIYIYWLLKREVKEGNIIHISKLQPVLKWYVRIPKKYQQDIINEFIELKLLKRLCRDSFEILPVNFHLRKPLTDGYGNPLW